MAIIQWLRDYSIVFMMIAFCGLLAFTFIPARRKRFEHDARIPLQDDR